VNVTPSDCSTDSVEETNESVKESGAVRRSRRLCLPPSEISKFALLLSACSAAVKRLSGVSCAVDNGTNSTRANMTAATIDLVSIVGHRLVELDIVHPFEHRSNEDHDGDPASDIGQDVFEP